MNKTIEFENMTFTELQWKSLAINILDPLLLNQYPFVYDGMTVEEYFKEKQYYGENYSNVLSGKYVPLWKQKETTMS